MKAFILVLFLFLQPLIPAQPGDQKSFDRIRRFDVQHYRMALRFDRVKRTVFGDSTITLRALEKPLQSIELDARNINFSSVTRTDGGSVLKYEYDKRKLKVLLDAPLGPGEEISIRFTYSARPRKGIYFVPASRSRGRTIRSAQIWTQGESEETHHWLPSYDFPDDKATTEQIITVGGRETVVGNGELISNTLNKNGTRTFHYKMNIPHSLYLTSFVVGRYLRVEDRYKDIPLGFYVYPGDRAVAEKAFGKTKNMMQVFEDLTGMDYPYNKYDQTIVARFPFGGMENITATTYADSEILLAGSFGPQIVQDLVAHELAHSWFGNLVTCRNWAELWTNESFASYMEAAYREKTNGRQDYLEKIEDDASQYFAYAAVSPAAKHGLYNTTADPENDGTMFDPVTYNKGSAVIHTLREEIGDENFWNGVKKYLRKFEYKNVETSDIRKVFEEESGKDLGWFFDQWVYRSGHPEVTVSQTFDESNGVLTLVFVQTAAKSDKPLSLYRLPLDIDIKTSDRTFNEKLLLDERREVVKIETVLKPERVDIDKSYKIPLKDLVLSPLVTKKKGA